MQEETPAPSSSLAEQVSSVQQVLSDPKWRALFKKFCTKEHSEETVEFWEQVQQFKQQNSPSREAAVAIYQTFLEPSAPKSLNIASALRKRIAEQLGIGSGSNSATELVEQSLLESSMFDETLVKVERDMQDPFDRFKSYLESTHGDTSASTAINILEEGFDGAALGASNEDDLSTTMTNRNSLLLPGGTCSSIGSQLTFLQSLQVRYPRLYYVLDEAW